jgi:FkbM family methyltransferase
MYGLLILKDKTKFKIRLDVKPVTDTHMIYESYGRKDYTPGGFTIESHYCVIDIGAHIGAFSIFAAKQAKRGQVYAYEPHPENFKLLKTNIKLNNLKNIEPSSLGVLGSKTAKLYIDETNNAGHSMFNKSYKHLTVKCTSLREIFDQNNIQYCDFLKMDCEGAEHDILFNTPEDIFDKIGAIVMEYHPAVYKKKGVSELQQLLKRNNFSVTLRTPQGSQGLMYAKRAKGP